MANPVVDGNTVIDIGPDLVVCFDYALTGLKNSTSSWISAVFPCFPLSPSISSIDQLDIFGFCGTCCAPGASDTTDNP